MEHGTKSQLIGALTTMAVVSLFNLWFEYGLYLSSLIAIAFGVPFCLILKELFRLGYNRETTVYFVIGVVSAGILWYCILVLFMMSFDVIGSTDLENVFGAGVVTVFSIGFTAVKHLNSKINGLRSETFAEIKDINFNMGGMKENMGELRSEMKERFAKLETKLEHLKT